MITDEGHPQMQAALRELRETMSLLLRLPMNQSAIDSMRDLLNSHRSRWRLKGVDFPVMVAMIVPRLGIIDLVRADLDRRSIEQTVVNMAKAHDRLGITMADITEAVRGAFPDFKPRYIDPSRRFTGKQR